VWCVKNKIPQSYQVGSLTVNMLAPGGRPGLKTKAAETGVLLKWATEFCAGPVGSALDAGETLHAAGQCLVEYAQILRDSGFKLSWDTCDRLMFLCLRHLNLMRDYGAELLPKAHMFVHLTQRAVRCGNPRMYSVFKDETLNLVIAKMAAKSHRARWEVGIFQRARLLPCVQKDSSWASFSCCSVGG
jgi:hypothetical protein